jgi:hypothetical protein
MHLTVEMVKELMPLLQRFVDTGYLNAEAENVEAGAEG